VCDAVKVIRIVQPSYVEAAVDVSVQILVAESWLAESGHARVPPTCLKVEASQSCNSTSQGMTNKHKLIVGILLEGLCHVWKNDFARVQPGAVEARMHGAVGALGWVGRWWVPFSWFRRLQVRCKVVGGGAIVIVTRVRDVFLRNGREVCYGVGDGVSAAKGEDESRVPRCVRKRDIAAGVRQEWPCVPCLILSTPRQQWSLHPATHCYKLEAFKVGVCAAAGALEGLLNTQASSSNAVRYIDYAREFLQLPEELLRNQGVVAGVDERLLCLVAMAASNGGEYHDAVQEDEAEDGGHEVSLSHSPRRRPMLIAVERG
jgi:hypothetical protein